MVFRKTAEKRYNYKCERDKGVIKMTKSEIDLIRKSLEKVLKEYGDDINNDRYSALVVTIETLDSIAINEK